MFGQWMGDNKIVLELENKEVIERFEELKRYKEIIKNIDKDFFFKFGETVLNLIQTQQAEIEERRNTKDLYYENKELRKLLEKKNKIIDEMTEWIEKHTKYYDEDGCYCEVEKDICNKNIECKECIKQCFESKAEKE